MAANEAAIADLAAAILDGAPIDWPSVESSADDSQRPLLDRLRVLATLAEIHRGHPVASLVKGARPKRVALDLPSDWGPLRVLEQIGRGAFGEVYRAWDTRLDREVALKLLPAGSREDEDAHANSIIEEGRLLARVRHPNVVTIYGAERIDDRVGLWMELVKGRTLEEMLAGGKRFGRTEVVNVGIQLCSAISAVHSAGLLHRDIKAHNVMLAEDGRVVLMDFGTGRELHDLSGGVSGTPIYLAPELLRGAAATARTDIYSAGVLLHHLLTGSYPVRARSLEDLRRAHDRHERTSVRSHRPDIPSKLARVIDRATEPRPERRYESAAALAADLASLAPGPKDVRWAAATAVAAALLLVAGVVWEVRGRQTGSSNRPVALLAGFAGLAPSAVPNDLVAGPPQIVVLPFSNQSAEPDSDYFADGLTDELIRNLAVIDGLQVRSRWSSFAFKDKPRDLREIGAQLAVNYALTGSVSRSTDELRVQAQLVRIADDHIVWSDRFDREPEDLFDIQEEISRAIVNSLRLKLGTGQRRYDVDLDTYDLYLKARDLSYRRGVTDPKAAAKLFQQVIDKDSEFTPAYAGLVTAYAYLSIPSYQGVSFGTAHAIMRPAAERALYLDPGLAEAHAAMGIVYARERDWESADEHFRRAIDLNPSLTEIYTNYSFNVLRPLWKFDQAERLLQDALRNDPLSLDLRREIGQVQFTLGRYADAIDTFEGILAEDPDLPFAKALLARSLTLSGKPFEAAALYDEMEGDRRLPHCALAYVKSGRRAETERLAVEHNAFPYRVVLINAALGDLDRVFEGLERLAAEDPQRVPITLTWPELAAMRKDPRYIVFRREFGLP